MPTIINLKNLTLLIAIFNLSSCFEKKVSNQNHGLSFYNKSSFSYMGLVERSIKLKFQTHQDDISVITAVIETEFDYNYPINYQWRLGEFLQPENSQELSGQISSLQKNQPVKIKLNVKGFNIDAVARFVRFEAFGTNPKHRIFTDGVVSSQKNNSFENIVQEVELYKKQKGDK